LKIYLQQPDQLSDTYSDAPTVATENVRPCSMEDFNLKRAF